MLALPPSLSFLLLLAASSDATKLLLPLYQYPEGRAWEPVYSAIEANPAVVFQVILNVDSGPGGPSGPDSSFVTATSKLNSYRNVETLGYVHCRYGKASQQVLSQNVSDWAAWNAYSGANVSVGGIFFDETPNTEGQGGANDVAFMQAVVGAAATAFGRSSSSSSRRFTTIFNPGSAVQHDAFWTLADYNVVYEQGAAAYSAAVLTANIPAGKAGHAAILIYDFASVGSASIASQWLQAIADAGVGSAHILDYDYDQATTADAPASLGAVALALAAVPVPAAAAAAAAAAPMVEPPPAPASGAAAGPTASPRPATTLRTYTVSPLASAAPSPAVPAAPAAASSSGGGPAPGRARSCIATSATTAGPHPHHRHSHQGGKHCARR